MNNGEILNNAENTAENKVESPAAVETQSETVTEKKDNPKGNADIKYYLRISLTLLIISAVTAMLLAFVNVITKDRIAANELAVMEQAIVGIFEDCTDIKLVDCELKEPVTAVYGVYADGTLIGYGIQSSPTGFKDVIGLIVGTDLNGNCLGVEITSLSDTPGVGTKVKDQSFLESFKGCNADSVKECDTIAGATISSKAVKSGIEAAVSLELFANNGAEEVVE